MSEPDYIDTDYESDEYYDEQGRKVKEFESFTETEPEVEQGYPCATNGQAEDVDFTADDAEYVSFQQMELNREEPLEQTRNIETGSSKLEEFSRKLASSSKGSSLTHPGYTKEDMSPTVRDPRCKSDTLLACLWPVYVGNFRCENRSDEFDSVREYFAWKGLHVRLWFRNIDEYHRDFQSKAGIYDMLVYFVSERDADYAIRKCHREIYKGYPLNVFPGREPVYFDPSRSLQATRMKSGRIYSELFFEKHVKFIQKVTVTCAVKFDTRSGAMEFASTADKAKAQFGERLFKFKPVPHRLRKQRFLEQDILDQIEAYLAYHPNALQMDPNDKYANMLLRNERPNVDPKPKQPVLPLRRGPTKQMQQKRLQQKISRERRRIAKAMAEGRKPRCFDRNKPAKQRFKKMVQKMKQGFQNGVGEF